MSGRPASPGGRRMPIIQTGRDPANGPAYYDHPSTSRLSREYGPSGSRDYGDSTRLVSVRPRSPPRSSRDLGAGDLPRIRTSSLDPGPPSSRRTADVLDSRPVIIKDSSRPPSPKVRTTGGAQLQASYLIPASSGRHHHRHASFNGGERLSTRDRNPDRESMYPVYQAPSSSIHAAKPGRDIRDRDVGSYLAPPQRRVRSGSHTGARPTSMIELDRGERLYVRTDRDGPPPVSARGLEPLNRKESLKSGGRELGDDLLRKDSLSQRYPRDGRDDPRYRDLPPRSSKGSRDEYIAYPPENPRQRRPRLSTLESESLHLSPTADGRHDRDSDRYRKHRYHGDHEDRHDRHRRRDYDDREENIRRRDHDERHDRERDGDRDRDRDRNRDHRRDHDGKYDDTFTKAGRSAHTEKDDRERRRYADYRDERERRHHYEDKDYRPRDEGRDTDRRANNDEHSSSDGHGLLAAGAVAGAAGLAAEEVRRHRSAKDDEASSGRERRNSRLPERERDRDHHAEPHRSAVPPLSAEEEREERRRRRRRQREQEDRYGTSAIESSSDERPEREPLRIEAPPLAAGEHALREQKSYERRLGDGDDEGHARRRRRRSHRRRRPGSRDPRDGDGVTGRGAGSSYSSSSGTGSDTEPRAPRILTPEASDTGHTSATGATAAGAASKAALPPKGILKRPKTAFPEESVPSREGVAPSANDAARKGIPKEARWTRINRRLVNPEALEQAGVRFDAYDDHVVVLKVLSKEEIDHFARRTHEIRERNRIEGGSGTGSGSGDGTVGAGE